MALNMRIEVTSGVAVTEVPDDIAAELEEAYETLKDLPSNRVVTIDDFATEADAKLFARQGRAWAEAHDPVLKFERKGDVKGEPTVVKFRIYVPTTRGPLTEEEKAKRAATREANRAAALESLNLA